MEMEALILDTINSMVLDLFTIEELVKKGIKEANFKWKFNFKNINLIPLLELYNNKGKVYKTIEATKFSELFQNLLRETHNIHNKIYDSKSRKKFIDYLEESTDCSKCKIREIYILRDDKS